MFWTAIFIMLIFVFINFQLVWLAALLGMALVVDLLSSAGRRSYAALRAAGKVVGEDLGMELKQAEEAKGSHPDSGVFVSLLSEAGKRAGSEIKTTHKKRTPSSKKIDASFAKIGSGSEALIKGAKKLLK